MTDVDGERFDWSRGDVFVIPAHRACTHRTIDEAILFRVTDAPVMKKLGFYDGRLCDVLFGTGYLGRSPGFSVAVVAMKTPAGFKQVAPAVFFTPVKVREYAV